jgi:plastocyanin
MKYAAVAVFLLFTACPHSHEDYSQNAPSKTSTSTSPTLHSRLDPSAPQRTALNPAGAPAANRTVNVELTEYAIQIPQTLNAAAYTFNIINAGHEAHSFVITGPGTQLALREPLQRGDSVQLNVTLGAGTYTVICPVDKHKDKGMSTTITVK